MKIHDNTSKYMNNTSEYTKNTPKYKKWVAKTPLRGADWKQQSL